MSSDSGLPASAMHNVTKLFKIKVIGIDLFTVSSIPYLCSAMAGSANIVISVAVWHTKGKNKRKFILDQFQHSDSNFCFWRWTLPIAWPCLAVSWESELFHVSAPESLGRPLCIFRASRQAVLELFKRLLLTSKPPAVHPACSISVTWSHLR